MRTLRTIGNLGDPEIVGGFDRPRGAPEVLAPMYTAGGHPGGVGGPGMKRAPGGVGGGLASSFPWGWTILAVGALGAAFVAWRALR